MERERRPQRSKNKGEMGRESRLPMASEHALTRSLSLEFEVDLSESQESLADEIKINDV